MAKQTFTTGQVLTAAQMTSLQQTAMLGGDASVKTTSYVLVAADAGTTVAMNAAGSTTITVNTGLFSAGDIVFIQNRGAGNCTVTAGTATVSTAGSLILPQNDGGILYFTSSSAAIFYDFIQTGATSPLTTKGDIWGYSTLDARIPIGTNGQVLTADSTQALGLKWAAVAGGGSGLTLIQRSTFSNVAGTSTTFDGVFSSTYKSYLVILEYVHGASAGDDLQLQGIYSGTTATANYVGSSGYATYNSASFGNIQNNVTAQFTMTNNVGVNQGAAVSGQLFFTNVGNSTANGRVIGQLYDGQADNNHFAGCALESRLYTGFLLKSSSSNITGAVSVYGLAAA